MRLLTDDQRFNVIIQAIRSYQDEDDMALLLITETLQHISLFVNDTFTTQDIHDEISECLALYNYFTHEKDNLDLPLVDDSVIDMLEHILNEIVEEKDGIW